MLIILLIFWTPPACGMAIVRDAMSAEESPTTVTDETRKAQCVGHWAACGFRPRIISHITLRPGLAVAAELEHNAAKPQKDRKWYG